jgi:NAD(P)H-quinone oxidoreductase subunit 5
MKSFALALALYGTVALVFSLLAGPKSLQALALGTMLIFGVAYLVAQGLADAAPAALTRRTVLRRVRSRRWPTSHSSDLRPRSGARRCRPLPVVGPLEWALIVLASCPSVSSRSRRPCFPRWAHHPSTSGIRVHIANGLYLNALLDRMIGGFRVRTPSEMRANRCS